MAKAIVAVSGGVDSMVMLDQLYHSDSNLAVAHFDHNMRASAEEDRNFVRDVATHKYGLPVHMGMVLEPGAIRSEEDARLERYRFLRHVAQKQAETTTVHLDAIVPGQPREGLAVAPTKICTAHHLDDLVETVAINFIRGTGWRGLACLNAPDVQRPLLESGDNTPMDRKAILVYAAQHNITFREDPTNHSTDFLRNRVRAELEENPLPWAQKMQLWHLWQRQKILRAEIGTTIAQLIPAPGEPWQRAWFHELEPNLALELLRAGVKMAGISATRPQLENFRQAILTYAPGKYFNLPDDKLVRINKTSFVLKEKDLGVSLRLGLRK